MRKAASAVAIAMIPFAATYVYFTIWRDYYFPGRYEVALHALVVAAAASALTLVTVTAFHLASYLRRRR